ncbi:hypothetical protein MVEN_01585700 [Mycena venus]|uniref:Myb/SANT-like domain-containing protein n=1 Tax=Mycena venus TaxID=2733690 RepID=A0A8H6XS98_9AGAR|nr:hypothetical protein MVEN_01585700 [Mycena venus]
MPRAPKTSTAPSTAPAAAPAGLPTSGDAAWLVADEKRFIEYLIEHVAEAGDNKNFKASTFRGAADHLELTHTRGGPKTAKSCEQKYRTLRKLWGLVDIIMGVSGWSWSEKDGIKVTPAMQSSWDDWVRVNVDAKRFRNKGWSFYDLMLPLKPEKAKGSNVFRPSLPSTEHQKSQSPDWDYAKIDESFACRDDGNEGDAGSGTGDDENNSSAGDDDENTNGDRGGMGEENKGENTSSSPPTPSAGPRGRVPVQQAPEPCKKPRFSAGAQALLNLNSTAIEFNEIMGSFCDILVSGSTNAPTASTSTAAKPNQLSPQRRVLAIELCRDVTQADIYLALHDDEEMRVDWILDELSKVGVVAFHPQYSSFDLF